ncbi:CDGSH iron-sulfur domain-containing protein 2 homolog [Bactrocera oleae]|uniref:CDGSH iron-sulfur domain-containing protein 2 homolog n=1 Tax=Bactrocera oleae TaxID=104688 RepID=UPI0006B77DF9|nr:CDGSH iron-sulfur domain-containing protein 2 homolog [Bactrocera oleae]XP_036233897.1 CDGSH iron-sulfur domain-containing protein 2 homolog [Bactrocera oleae]XP_036233898.1 CDGSH iron-sulfur domain-containing protein 2 homolog [Bactrocera oleae]
MQGVSSLVKTTIPDYLSNLPIPDSFTGWFKLSFKDWLALIPPTAVVAGLGYVSYLAFCPAARKGCSGSGRCNQSIRKSEAKVVDMIDIENIAEKAAFCRCWKTKNWPYCDGSHGEHNKQTGDNVGPVVLQRKK